MQTQAAYEKLLSGLAAPSPAAQGVGQGPPPVLPGLPPPPTGMGAMPVGDPGTTKKAAADQAVLSLREAAGHFPSLTPQINALVDALKAAAVPKPAGSPGAPAIPGKPSPLGTPPPNPDPIDASGSPGGI